MIKTINFTKKQTRATSRYFSRRWWMLFSAVLCRREDMRDCNKCFLIKIVEEDLWLWVVLNPGSRH